MVVRPDPTYPIEGVVTELKTKAGQNIPALWQGTRFRRVAKIIDIRFRKFWSPTKLAEIVCQLEWWMKQPDRCVVGSGFLGGQGGRVAPLPLVLMKCGSVLLPARRARIGLLQISIAALSTLS